MSARSVKGFHVLNVMRRHRLVEAPHNVHVAIGEAYDAGAKQAVRDAVRLLEEAKRKGAFDETLASLKTAVGIGD